MNTRKVWGFIKTCYVWGLSWYVFGPLIFSTAGVAFSHYAKWRGLSHSDAGYDRVGLILTLGFGVAAVEVPKHILRLLAGVEETASRMVDRHWQRKGD